MWASLINIIFTFSHAMDPESIKITGIDVDYDVSWTDVYNLVINPHDNLIAGQSYTIFVTGLCYRSCRIKHGIYVIHNRRRYEIRMDQYYI